VPSRTYWFHWRGNVDFVRGFSVQQPEPGLYRNDGCWRWRGWSRPIFFKFPVQRPALLPPPTPISATLAVNKLRRSQGCGHHHHPDTLSFSHLSRSSSASNGFGSLNGPPSSIYQHWSLYAWGVFSWPGFGLTQAAAGANCGLRSRVRFIDPGVSRLPFVDL